MSSPRPPPSPSASLSIPAQVQSSSSPARYPRPGSPLALHSEQALATSQRAREAVSKFTRGLAQRVIDGAACDVADAFLELLDVFLVGGGNVVDLGCGELEAGRLLWRKENDTFGKIGHLVLAHGFEGLTLEFALHLGGDAKQVDAYAHDCDQAG